MQAGQLAPPFPMGSIQSSTARRSFLASTTAHGLILGALVVGPFVLFERPTPDRVESQLAIGAPRPIAEPLPDPEPEWEVLEQDSDARPALEPYPVQPEPVPVVPAEHFDALPLEELAFVDRPMFLRPTRSYGDSAPLNDEPLDSEATAMDLAELVESNSQAPGAMHLTPPAKIMEFCPRPNYTDMHARRGWQGTVRCRLHVNAEGFVTEVQILESSGFVKLDKLAQEALERWRFTPAMCAGEALKMTLDETIIFRP